MLACLYAGPLIGICWLADVSRTAEAVSVVYFLLCVKAVASSLDCRCEVNEFKFEWRCYIHFQSNTLEKSIKALFPPAMD